MYGYSLFTQVSKQDLKLESSKYSIKNKKSNSKVKCLIIKQINISNYNHQAQKQSQCRRTHCRIIRIYGVFATRAFEHNQVRNKSNDTKV